MTIAFQIVVFSASASPAFTCVLFSCFLFSIAAHTLLLGPRLWVGVTFTFHPHPPAVEMKRPLLLRVFAVLVLLASTTAASPNFSDFFTVDEEAFFQSTYQQSILVDRRQDAQTLSPFMQHLARPLGDVNTICQAFEQQGSPKGGLLVSNPFRTAQCTSMGVSDLALCHKPPTQLTNHHIPQRPPTSTHTQTHTHTHSLSLAVCMCQVKEQGQTRQVTSCEQMHRELDAGAGVLVRFEGLDDSPATQSAGELQHAVHAVFGTESTIHLYHATQNESRALMPHTDPYDVLVIQVQGSKTWTTCVPDAYTTADAADDSTTAETPDDTRHPSPVPNPQEDAHVISQFNDAQLGQLQEIRRQKQQGCTAYEDEHLRGMRCEQFVLREGDTMYMPKGIIHYALSGEQGSSHITISLERKGLAWADAIMYGAARGAAVDGADDNNAFLRRFMRGMQRLTSDYQGVPYLEAMPSWKLTSSHFCPWVPPGTRGSRALDAVWAGHEHFTLETTHERALFAKQYTEMCRGALPHVLDAARAAGDLDVILHPDHVLAKAGRACSEVAAASVLEMLCAKGKLPVDVTSASFQKSVLPKEVCTCTHVVHDDCWSQR